MIDKIKQLPKIDYSKNLDLLRYDLSDIQNIEKYTVMNNTYTAVQKLRAKLVNILPITIDYNTQKALHNAFNDAEKDEVKQSQEYAAFCVKCDRKELPLLEFEGWIKLEGGNK
jgi:hypothetical protein